MKERSKRILKKQRQILAAIFVCVACCGLGFGYFVIRDANCSTQNSQILNADLPADKMNPQDIWMNRLESQNTLFEQKIKYLEEVISSNKQQEERIEREKKALKQDIDQLRAELKITQHSFTEKLEPSNADPLFKSIEELSFPSYTPLVEMAIDASVETIKNVTTTIPAGTTVKALLTSSVDADCGVYSSSDPIPVKLRLLDDGHLPKGVDIQLKGGILIGSAVGNLSSERVFMRLERLTQVNPDGQFVETEVAGYVSGEDGKYGVRGSVVDKSAKIVKNAAISGLFGEASQVLQSAVGRYRIENYLNTNQSINDPLVPGALGGTSNAFDMLADYYIQRAEQVKPVIQVNAGRVVDITFTHGVEIGELHAHEKIQEIRERNRRNT